MVEEMRPLESQSLRCGISRKRSQTENGKNEDGA